MSAHHAHYADYQLRDGVLAGSTVVANVLLYLLGTNGVLLAIADVAFIMYGAPWLRQEYQKNHEALLDELMSIYKWMTNGYGPSVTQGAKIKIVKDGKESEVEQPTLYIEMLAILAAFNDAKKLNVWQKRTGDFSELYWNIMRQAPHYKTKPLDDSSAVEPTATAVVDLTKVMMRNWLYMPANKVSKQAEQQPNPKKQEEGDTILQAVGGQILEFVNMARETIPSTSVVGQLLQKPKMG